MRRRIIGGKSARYLSVLCSAALSILIARTAEAVTLSVSSASAAPGDVVEICVDLASEGSQVAGIQGDLVWNPQCAELDQGSCRAGGHDKPLHKSARGAGRLKVLVLALDNVDPIPDGSRLYCCNFRVHSDVRSTSCPITIQNAGASDPRGQAIPTNPLSGAIQLVGVGRGEPEAPARSGQPAAPAPGPLAGSEAPRGGEPGSAGQPAAGFAAGTPAVPPVVRMTPQAERPAGLEQQRASEATTPTGEPAERTPGAPVAGEATPGAMPAGTPEVPAVAATSPAAAPPTVAPTQAPTRAPTRVATPTEKAETTGCQLAVAKARGSGFLLLVAGGLLLVTRRRRWKR